jgi:hypothetical protein
MYEKKRAAAPAQPPNPWGNKNRKPRPDIWLPKPIHRPFERKTDPFTKKSPGKGIWRRTSSNTLPHAANGMFASKASIKSFPRSSNGMFTPRVRVGNIGTFDPLKHPRFPKGGPFGGKFRPKG